MSRPQISPAAFELTRSFYDKQEAHREEPYTMNHELAGQILDIVRMNPENFDMSSWVRPEGSESGGVYDGPNPAEAEGCGTTMCVAGWSQFLTEGAVLVATVEDSAVEALGISWGLAAHLFFSEEDRAIEALEVMSKPDATEKAVYAKLWRVGEEDERFWLLASAIRDTASR